MESLIQTVTTFFWALGFLLFFGPIVIIVSLIGKLKLGLINIDLSEHSKLSRFVLAIVGAGIWLAIYIPVANFAFKSVPQINTPTVIIPVQTLITETPNTITQPIVSSESPVINNTSTAVPDFKYIVITEVLGNPCGGDSRNEFIEIYNSGEHPIDISGWWITDGTEADKIISWEQRYPNIKIGFLTITNTTVIPPRSYAIVLAPGYPFVTQSGYIMPYVFPDNTVIMTVEKGQLLGDETNGIAVTSHDVIVLYQGNEFAIDKVISSYGSPILSSSPTAVKDDNMDEIPIYGSINQCWSVERILAVNEDVESNWRKVTKSSPGSGNYP